MGERCHYCNGDLGVGEYCIYGRPVFSPVTLCEACAKKPTEVEVLRERIEELKSKLASRDKDLSSLKHEIAILAESVDGLLMYEDEAIAQFAERRDPMPHVMIGPRKWLDRIRKSRKNLPKNILKPWEEQ